jgi:hypothetical protein
VTRPDLQNARRIIAEATKAGEDWVVALKLAVARGELLPAAAAVFLGGQALRPGRERE